MTRFLAVTTQPTLTEEEFKKAFDRTGKWRYAKRGWVVKVYWAAETGKLVIESEAPDQELFEEWLNKKGWPPEEIHTVSFVQEAGLVWPMRF